MLKFLCFSLFCCFPLAACNSVSGEMSTPPSGFTTNSPVLASGLLVSFNANVSEANARALISQQGSHIIRTFHQPGLFHITVPNNVTGADMIQRLESMPQVRYAELNNTRQRLR